MKAYVDRVMSIDRMEVSKLNVSGMHHCTITGGEPVSSCISIPTVVEEKL